MKLQLNKTDGTEISVELKKVGIAALPKLLDDKLSLEAKAQLFLGEEEVKIADLTPDSQMDVYEFGMDLNEANLSRFMDRQKKQVKLMTGMDMSEVLRGKLGGLTS